MRWSGVSQFGARRVILVIGLRLALEDGCISGISLIDLMTISNMPDADDARIVPGGHQVADQLATGRELFEQA